MPPRKKAVGRTIEKTRVRFLLETGNTAKGETLLVSSLTAENLERKGVVEILGVEDVPVGEPAKTARARLSSGASTGVVPDSTSGSGDGPGGDPDEKGE